MPDNRSYQDPFYGWTVPKAITLCLQTLKECKTLPFSVIQNLIKLSENYVLHQTTDSLNYLTEISEKHQINFERIVILFNGFVKVLRLALKPPAALLKPEIFKEDLRELKFSEEIIEEFHNRLFGPKREQLYSIGQEQDRARLSTLQSFRWNLDVTLTTASLSRCVEPLLVFEFKTSDNRNLTFEVPLKKFNELRYNTALILKEMEEVDNRPALKMIET